MTVLWVEQRRGFAVESVHGIDAVVCDESGRVVDRVGEDMLTTFRSAAKPFQLEVSLGALPDEVTSRLSDAELALGAASHHGEPVHIQHVHSLLARLGRGPEHLFCGPAVPSHGPSAEALFASGGHASAVHHNCSGKHCFLAAAARALGGPEDYRAPQHALQVRQLENMQRRTRGGVVDTVTDGCGIPCFVLPLSAMARAWAELAVAMVSDTGALGRIGRAMQAHPLLMSGSQAFDGWLIERTGAVAKVGAQGLMCVALPEQGLGVAIKARSGCDLARPVAVATLLDKFFPGLLRDELPARFTRVYNAAGEDVGAYCATLR